MSEVLISATANRKYDILISRDRENAVLLSARGPQGAPGSGGGGGGSGTVTSVNASGGTTGFSFSGGPITDSGTLTLAVSNASTIRSAIGLGTLATQSGTFSGTSSGTNTGDQTITLTGDVIGSGTGTFAATIANDAVTYAKLQNVSATDKVLGRSSVGAGDVEEITCTAAGRALMDDADASAQRTTLGLGTLATQSGTFSGTSSGTNTGDQTISLTGDVTGSGTGSFAATIANDAVTLAKLADLATDTLIGRATSGTGDPEVITCTAAGRALLDDANSSAQLTTLGAAPLASPAFTGTPTVPDDPYDATGWNGSTGIPTKNAIRDKIESLSSSGVVCISQQSVIAMSPADSTTYYVGITNFRTTYTDASIRVPITGTVIEYWVRGGVAGGGTTENVNLYLRLNDTTDFGNFTQQWNGYVQSSSGAISQAVTSGDTIALKVVTPAWVTNPTNVYVGFWIKIQA